MYCKKCGKQIEEDSIFCSFCSAKQSESGTKSIGGELRIDSSNPNYIAKKQTNLEKYDSSYKRDFIPTIVGIILLIISAIFYGLTDGFANDNNSSMVLFFIPIIFWIFCIIWVVHIASELNRNLIGWGMFSFIFPFLALIIIGLLKKIKRKELNEDIVSLEQERLLINKDEKDILIIKNKLNGELHNCTVKEWKRMRELGTANNFYLVRWW